ncbi:MAG: integrase core domain-containing protein [Pseudomonadota bacterium]
METGTPWESGCHESFNARLGDAFLKSEIVYSLRAAQVLIEDWRKHYNTKTTPERFPTALWAVADKTHETINSTDQRPIMHQKSNRTTHMR